MNNHSWSELGQQTSVLLPNCFHGSKTTTPLRTAFSLPDCQKYPPSLCHLLMTRGPMFLLLAALDRGVPAAARPLVVFGRVPMSYYLVHLPLIHAMAVVTCLVSGRNASLLFGLSADDDWTDKIVPALPFPLGLIYLLWLLAVCLLYPMCLHFGAWKRNART